MAFTADLPRVSPQRWSDLWLAFQRLVAAMRRLPRSPQQLSVEPRDVEEMATALTEVGAALDAARLKNVVISHHSWTGEDVERWFRAFLSLAFHEPAPLPPERLSAFLSQRNEEGRHPGRDPETFHQMTTCAQDLARELLDKTRPADTVEDLNRRLLPAWRDGLGETEQPLPPPPDSFDQLPGPSRLRANEVWLAASRLRGILNAWETWWIDLRCNGDADPGVAWRYREAASQCVRALFTLRVSAPPFESEEIDTILAILPPAPSGQLARTDLEPDGKGGWVEVKTVAWQRDPGFLNEYWGHARSRRMGRLIGELSTLLELLRSYPLAVLGVGPAAEASGGDGSPNVAADGGEDESDRWITVSDAATTAGGLSTGTISRAVKNGQLRGNGKTGRDRRIDVVDLGRFLRDRAKKPEPGESTDAVEAKVRRQCRD